MKFIFELFLTLLTNFPLIAAVMGMLIGQTIKIVYYYFRDKELDFSHFLEAGGMPSGHSSMVCALTTGVGLAYGFSSPLFALSLIFSIVVMYDAAGVRRAAGKQALILNKIIEDIYTTGKISNEKLQELMGHSPLEVLVGAILGVFIAVLMYLLIF